MPSTSSTTEAHVVSALPARPTSVVELKGVGLRYAGRPDIDVLRGVDLSVQEGSFVSLIGPSGCGKSTLLRIVAGILEPSEGVVRVEGRSAADAQRSHRIGFVFQDAALLPWRSVRANVELLGELVGQEPSTRRRRATELLGLVGLGGKDDLRPGQLSGGMRQRASIARALAIDPAILLMDEPFSAVDEFQREQLNAELLHLWQEQHSTVLFVTHNIEEAAFLSDYVCVMSSQPGQIVEVMRIELPRPRNEEVRVSAEFVALRRQLREILVR